MTETEHVNDGCTLCLVRAMTAGIPVRWWPEQQAEVSGVVIRTGEEPSGYHFSTNDMFPFLDLWTEDRKRVRVKAMPSVLLGLVRDAEIEVGDTVTFRYLGKKTVPSGKMAGREYPDFALDVKRGHH